MLTEKTAAIAASYVPDKPAMIREITDLLRALHEKRDEIDDAIVHANHLIAALRAYEEEGHA